MSDGGIQKGYTFWATIRIKGVDIEQGEKLSKEKLQATMDKIRAVLADVQGDVIHSVQTAKKAPIMSTELRQSTKFRKKVADGQEDYD